MRTIMMILALLFAIAARGEEAKEHYAMVAVVDLPKVSGRIDHLAFDEKTLRIFIAAIGNNSVEVVDPLAEQKDRFIRSLAGLDEPQGIAFLPDARKLAVACGGDGSVRIYDGDTLKLERTVELKSDADNVHYDEASKRLYVGHSDGAIAVIDPAEGKVLADIKVSGHPEGFALDPAAKRVYVNVPDTKQVEVIDLEKAQVVDRWKLKERANYPMALDAAHHRLLIGCRAPAQLDLIDTQTGKVVSAVKCPGDVDDVFISADGKQAYAIGGEGKVGVYDVGEKGELTLKEEVATTKGARTGLLLPDGQLLIAAPGDPVARLLRWQDPRKRDPAELDEFKKDLEKIRTDSSAPLTPFGEEPER